MAEAQEQDGWIARGLNERMEGSVVRWARNPLDTSSRTPSQNDPPAGDKDVPRR